MASVQVLPKVEHKNHHNITENNNIDLSLDAFDEKLSNVAKIEKALFALYQLLKECALIIQGELQSSQLNKIRAPSSYEHFTTKKPSMTEPKPPSNLHPPRLNLRQYFYRLLVQLTSLAADLTAGSTGAHAAASVLLLNVLNALRHIKTAISGIVTVSKDDPVIVNVSSSPLDSSFTSL